MAEDEDSPMAEEELPRIARKAAVPELLEQQRKEKAAEEVGHISKDKEMAAEEGLMSNAIGAISGRIDPLNAQRWNRLARGEHLLRSLRKLKHNPGK